MLRLHVPHFYSIIFKIKKQSIYSLRVNPPSPNYKLWMHTWNQPTYILTQHEHRDLWLNGFRSSYPKPVHVCTRCTDSYVYRTVHHLDSWIKRDQLDVTCFIISLFNAQHVSGVNTSIVRSLRLICWVISWVVLLWFDVCCVCRLQPASGYHTTPAKPQRNTNTHRTRAIQPMK